MNIFQKIRTYYIILFLFFSFGIMSLGQNLTEMEDLYIEEEPLPSSFSVKKLESGNYIYTISNLPKIQFNRKKIAINDSTSPSDIDKTLEKIIENQNKRIKEIEKYFTETVPDCILSKYDIDNRTVTFTTKRKITYYEWENVFNSIGHDSAYLPYWDEVCLMGSSTAHTSSDFYQLTYQCEFDVPDTGIYDVIQESKNAIIIKIFSLTGKKSFIIVFRLKKEQKGEENYTIEQITKKISIAWDYLDQNSLKRKLKNNYTLKYNGQKYNLTINRTRASCMCHDKYALRLFLKDKCVWKYPEEFKAVTDCFIVDLNNDKNDEILIFTHGHQSLQIHIFEPKTIVKLQH